MYSDQTAGNTIEDSIQRGQSAACRASAMLDAILGDLTGENGAVPTQPAPAPAPLGLVWSADSLASHLNRIADRLEDVRARLSNPKVIATPSVQSAAALNALLASQGY